jgi:predicted HicB family RNase H-like nuclease
LTPAKRKPKGGRPKVYEDRIESVVRLEPELMGRLDEEARKRQVSRNYVIERAIINFLDGGLVDHLESD